MAEGQYKFSIGLDETQLRQDIANASKMFGELAKDVQKAGLKIDESFKTSLNGVSKPVVPRIDTKSVEQATTQFNGLNVATQQLVRELPAASMGFNTFFLAISNNLPIFADQVKRVNEENKNLAAQGKPTTSVLKQIGKSLLSWQTGLVLGVTVLSMYGKEIVSWVTSLFKGKKALDASAEATKNLNKAIEEGGLGIGDEIYKLKELQRAWINLGDSLESRKKFIEENKSAFDELGVSVQNVADADRLLIDQTGAYILALKARAQAAAAQKLAEAEYEKVIKKQIEKEELEESISKMPDEVVSSYTPIYSKTRYGVKTTGYKTNYVTNKDKVKAQEELEDINNTLEETTAYADALFNMSTEFSAEAERLLKEAGLKESDNNDNYNNDAERIAREIARKREQTQREIADKTASLASDAQRAATDATIQAMAEGLEKEKAQINADYDAKEQAIIKREEELKKLQGGELTDAQTADFASLRASNEAMRAKAITEAEEESTERLNKALNDSIKDLADYYIQYGTLKEKILSTTKKYDVLIAEAQNEGERRALTAERDALLAEYEVVSNNWAKDLVGKTTVELNKMLADLEAQAEQAQATFEAMGSSETNDAKQAQKTINELNAKIKYLRSLLNKAGKSVSDDNWAEATQVFQSIASSAREAADGIAGLDENLAYMLRSLADLAGAATNITASIQALEKAVETVDKVSAVLAIIGAVIQAISYIANIFNENAEATQRATDALRAYNAELERINNANISNAYSNIFGKDEYGEFSARLKAVREYQTEIDKIYAEADRDKYFGRYKGFESDDMTLSADMRSGWQKFWGTGDENVKKTSLNEFFNNGVLDVEKLKAYYDTYGEYLDESEKELVEKLISNGELLQENIDAVTNYLQDKFGSLGGTISDALVDAFKNGTDAAEAMGNAVANIMEQIAKDMAYASFIQPLLDEANIKIAELNKQRMGMSDEEYFEQLMAIGTTLMGDAADAQEGYNQFMENLKWYAEQNGLEMFGTDTGAKDTGIARASQESVDELNGRATAIQSHTYSIMHSQQQLVQDTAQALRYLSHIDDNTSGLKTMQQDMASMRKDINTMVTMGVTMR